MRRTQEKFAKKARLANRRWWATMKRDRKTISKINKHVAANSAQIKENAKKAQKDLEKTMRHWDYKVNSFKRSSKNAQSKLRAQFRAQDKAQRAWANNRIASLVA